MIKQLHRLISAGFGGVDTGGKWYLNLGLGMLFSVFALSNLNAQAPGRPHVIAPDAVMGCTDESVILTAEYLEIGETNSQLYEVTEIEYAPPFPFTGGTAVDATRDDSWSNVVNLPFDFCYFGETYQAIQVGTNGQVTFNATYPVNQGGTNPWSFTASVPSPSLVNNAIFGVYMDIHPDPNNNPDTGEINYAFFGEYPARTLVVSFPEIPYFSCSNTDEFLLTSQIVLYETTNVIEVYVNRRDSGCSWRDGRAIIGIQNQNGTVGYTPPGRNTGDWAAEKEAWRFTPAGEDIFEFWWEDSEGNVVSTDRELEVFPQTADEWYKAVIEYEHCNGEVVKEEDIAYIDIRPDFEVTLGRDRTACYGTSVRLNANLVPEPSSEVTYLWSTGETTPSIEVTESGEYSVTVSVDGTVITCSTSDEVNVNFTDAPVVDLGANIETCFVEEIVLDATPSNMDAEGVEYEWYKDGERIEGENGSTLVVSDLGFYEVVASLSGCDSYSSVTVSAAADLFVDLGNNIKTCGGMEITLHATTNEPNVTYTWYLNDELIAGENAATITVVTRDVNTPDEYKVVIDNGGCTGVDSIYVSTYDVGNCIISEGISPDGSAGYNDSLDLEFLSDRSGIRKLQIFNRHGRIVYKKDNYVNQWVGQSDSDDKLPSGTYYYVIDMEQEDPVYGKQATGWIYLNRK